MDVVFSNASIGKEGKTNGVFVPATLSWWTQLYYNYKSEKWEPLNHTIWRYTSIKTIQKLSLLESQPCKDMYVIKKIYNTSPCSNLCMPPNPPCVVCELRTLSEPKINQLFNPKGPHAFCVTAERTNATTNAARSCWHPESSPIPFCDIDEGKGKQVKNTHTLIPVQVQSSSCFLSGHVNCHFDSSKVNYHVHSGYDSAKAKVFNCSFKEILPLCAFDMA